MVSGHAERVMDTDEVIFRLGHSGSSSICSYRASVTDSRFL